MTRIIATIQGEKIRHFLPSGLVTFIGDVDIDCDGSGGNPDHDPYFQPDTSYHFQGKALNAYTTNFIVVPPQVVSGVVPVVLGCRAKVRDLRTNKRADALVGDVGPRAKVGEISVALARELGIPSSPVSGGEEEFCFSYELFPGQPAYVHGVNYPLQAS